MSDPHQLQRFVDAQARVWPQVQQELAAGRKASHWMWFVFPQCKGLGRSATAQHYGIASRAEALAYWQHPLLGPRLREATALMLAVPQRSALQILGTPDDLKFASSMTLFEQVAPEEPLFAQALARFCGGQRDVMTLALI
ncbi:MAG: DUF1810 domain-containing protein [Burkholderiales bacterium]|nr:DUF1810 domain-containing protein [Burkholderiales bacterium]